MAETDVRISELTDTTTSAANDDYIALDGATYGTRKMLASNLVGPEASARAAGDEALDEKIGTLSNLTTTAKGSAVAAINEVDSHADTAQNTADTNAAAIGTLSSLTTDAKGSLVAAINEVDSHADGKVDKVNGKGLSTNDYTDAEKTKLSGIEAGAEVNDVTSVAGKTGAVTLAGGDVSYSDETTYEDGTVGAAIGGLKSDLSDLETAVEELGPGLSDAAKEALLACFEKVAWTDTHGQDYYDALENALGGYPKITADLNLRGHRVLLSDTVNGLKDYLTVKYYDTASSAGTVLSASQYTLSGQLTAGRSLITATYNTLSAYFYVDVIGMSVPSAYTRKDYINVVDNGSTAALNRAANINEIIPVNTGYNLNRLSYYFDHCPTDRVKNFAKHVSVALFGGRTQGGIVSSVGVYVCNLYANLVCHAHGFEVQGDFTDIANSFTYNTVNEGILYNGNATPSYLEGNGLRYTFAWVNDNDVSVPLVYFSNKVSTSTGDQYITMGVKLGVLKIVNPNGDIVKYLVPVVRNADNVIGVYDCVSNTFYTAATATYATIGNSNCIYEVGMWS